MIRMSSLPTAQYCGKANHIGADIETTQSLRSTVFHKFAETGTWPELINKLPEEDIEEIKRWKIPHPMHVKSPTSDDDIKVLSYQTAVKEQIVALDKKLEFIEVSEDVPQAKIAETYPECLTCGHLDMAWVLKEWNAVVVNDIKSSIFAVKDKANSLQLHAYGLALARKEGCQYYLPAIWDASDGKHYVGNWVDINSFDIIDIESRILSASANKEGNFVTGSHCSGCWKRKGCPAHLAGVDDMGPFAAILNGSMLDADVRDAIVKLKQVKDTAEKIDNLIKDIVRRKGKVLSEDGSKAYCCALRSGRASIDQSAIAKALGVQDLKKYQKKGEDYMVWEWRNNK